MIINDLVNPVISKLRQRTEFASIIPYYAAVAILDITENIEFDELKVTGPLTNFVQNIAEYPIVGYDPNGIIGNPFINAVDHRLTFIDSWFTYFDSSGVITPGLSTGYELNARDLRVVEPLSKILGIPSVYCLHGDKKNKGVIIVGQMPNNPYACQMRYQREHPFNLDKELLLQAQSNTVLSARLGQSFIYMPNDWTDIIVYYTAEKICDDVGMNEVGMQYHQKLFGYKDRLGNEMPGLITAKKTQQERQTGRNSRSIRPVVRRYT